MSENNDMQCPECGGELPGPPGRFNKCCHCGGRIYWYGRKVLKKPKLTERPVVIEPLSPNTYEPPEVPEKDPERIEQEKKRKAQWELDQLVQNALEEEEVAKRQARWEEEEAKRKALEEEEKSRLKFIRQIDKANQEDRRKRKAAHQEALRKEKERIQFLQRRASDWKGVVGVCKILFILIFPALLFEGYAYEGLVRLVNFLCQCWVDLIFSLGK